MRNILFLFAFMFISVTYAHTKTTEEKMKVYEVIQNQLEEGKIDVKTAQKMWAAYIRCCKE